MQIGKIMIALGLALTALGALIFLLDKISFPWPLPGDFVFEWRGLKVFFPLGTSILLSLLFSLILWILRK